jgi:hypothetical protein
MPYNMSDPKYWFDCAEQARARANAMENPVSKAKMLRIAEDCEDLGLSAQLLPKSEDGQPKKSA